ncbi:MAG: caspase domain-containing protein, partial [Pseudanabaena sp.]
HMGIARRQFLQAGLASLIGWQFITRDRVALAADQFVRQATGTTLRKRALLIGINQYDAKDDSPNSSQNFSQNNPSGWLPLHGCVNDVELQRELLIYRFGFSPQDIVTLTDREATRTNINNAINEHLVAQTLPDDLVMVHFSGHGSRLGNYNTLVPVDSGLPQKLENLQDITLREWQSWLKEITTDRLLCVIDAGFYYPNFSAIGNFRLRSRIGRSDWQAPQNIQQIEKQVIGTVLRAASGDMLCADAQWSGFSSGAFTYALVQQLWQITPATTIHVVMSNLATTLDRQVLHNENLSIHKQVAAMVEADPVKKKTIATSTFAELLASPNFGSDGVITNASDRRNAEVSLAGLPINVLSNYIAGSTLQVLPIKADLPTVANASDDSAIPPKQIATSPQTIVQVKSRNGFNAKVEVLNDYGLNPKLETGQTLQEVKRAISHNIKLAIALDAGLSKIERVDATSAFSTLPNMFGVNANEQCADCLFGVQSASYGLFTVGHTPILGSFGSVGESVGVAIKRLQPFLESLLAAKLIRATENQATSHLDVRVTLKAMLGADERSVTLASRTSARANLVPLNNDVNNTVRTKAINIGDRLECQIENFSDQPLYVRIFCLDPRSKLLTPNFIATPYANDGVISPTETLTIPYPKAPMNWAVSAPQGMVDVQVVISRSPLLQVAKTL